MESCFWQKPWTPQSLLWWLMLWNCCLLCAFFPSLKTCKLMIQNSFLHFPFLTLDGALGQLVAFFSWASSRQCQLLSFHAAESILSKWLGYLSNTTEMLTSKLHPVLLVLQWEPNDCIKLGFKCLRYLAPLFFFCFK